jgi:hypothetical protein
VAMAHVGGALGTWYSLLTATRVMCRPFRVSRLDVYSRAPVNCGGRLCVSRIDLPASRGDEMRCFDSVILFRTKTGL